MRVMMMIVGFILKMRMMVRLILNMMTTLLDKLSCGMMATDSR